MNTSIDKALQNLSLVESERELRECYDQAVSELGNGDLRIRDALVELLKRRCLGPVAEPAQELLAAESYYNENLNWLCGQVKAAQELWKTSLLRTLALRLDEPVTVSCLFHTFEEGESSVQRRCLSSLSAGLSQENVRVGMKRIIETEGLERNLLMDAIRTLAPIASDVWTQELLLSTSASEDHSIGNRCSEVLEKADKTEQLRLRLEEAASSPSRNTRRCAARSLARWIPNSPATREVFYRLFEDSDNLVRGDAADSFYRKLENETVVDELLEILKDKSRSVDVRVSAARALKSGLGQDRIRQVYAEVYTNEEDCSLLQEWMISFDFYTGGKPVLIEELLAQLANPASPFKFRRMAINSITRGIHFDNSLPSRLQEIYRTLEADSELATEFESAFQCAKIPLED
jgi:hypothetical protein